MPNTGTTSMTVVDAKTHTILYSDAHNWTDGSPSSGTEKLIDALQEEMSKE
jgi:hypothetical protein